MFVGCIHNLKCAHSIRAELHFTVIRNLIAGA